MTGDDLIGTIGCALVWGLFTAAAWILAIGEPWSWARSRRRERRIRPRPVLTVAELDEIPDGHPVVVSGRTALPGHGYPHRAVWWATPDETAPAARGPWPAGCAVTGDAGLYHLGHRLEIAPSLAARPLAVHPPMIREETTTAGPDAPTTTRWYVPGSTPVVAAGVLRTDGAGARRLERGSPDDGTAVAHDLAEVWRRAAAARPWMLVHGTAWTVVAILATLVAVAALTG